MAWSFPFTTVSAYGQLPDSNHIRLLRAQPSGDEACLRFSLEVYSRDQAPKYLAISYCWGDGPASKTILLNDKRHAIRENLWWCLYHIRERATTSSAGESTWSYLWVDALCINQSSIHERSSQVRSMDQTYANAEKVIAWLGLEHEADEDSGAAAETEEGFIDLGMNPHDLAKRVYWTRMWIVQEISLAKDVEVTVGAKYISWRGWETYV